MVDLVRDARRFIRYYKWTIENTPLQVYTSALVFSPARSLIRELFKQEDPEWITTKPAMQDDWSSCLQTLEGHSGPVSSVAFSHDDKHLASASYDNTVKIWDTASGKCLQTLEGHSKWVSSVAFSHDEHLASASRDGTVKIWDTVSGKCLQTLEGHSESVSSVAFSHDDKHLASASHDTTVRTWDTASGKCLLTLNVSTTLHNISFDAASQYLRTEIGAIVLDVLSASGTVPNRTVHQKPQYQGPSVSSDGKWIMCNSKNLLRLPQEYRPVKSAVTASTVAIGCASGRVLIFSFHDPQLLS